MSGEKIVSIAERENKSNIQNICDLLFGFVDLMTINLVILPLYPNLIDEHIYSVNLFAYIQTAVFNRFLYWVLFVTLIMIGGLKVLLNQIKIEKGRKIITMVSLTLSVVTILVLAMAREAYAIVMVSLMLIIKVMLFLKITSTNR